MPSRKIRYLQGSAIEAVAMPITILIGILVIPAYLSYIGPEKFGYWIALYELMTFLSLFNSGFDFYIIQTIAHETPKNEENTKQNLSSIFSLLILVVCWVIILCVIVYFLLPFFGLNPLSYGSTNLLYILISIALCVNILQNSLVSILRGQNRLLAATIFGLITKILLQILPLLFLFLDFGLISFAYSQIITFTLMSIVIFLMTAKYLKERLAIKHIQRRELLEAGKFVARCFFGKTGYSIFNYTDAIIISSCLSTLEVTIYALTLKLGNVTKYITARFVSVALPSLAQLIAEENYRRLQQVCLVLFRISLRIAIFFAAVIALFNKLFLSNWVGIDKYGGLMLTLLSAIICFRESVVPVFTSIIFSTKDVKWINRIIFFESILNLALSLYLVRQWGITGVAFATVVSTCLFSFSYMVFKSSNVIKLGVSHFFVSSTKVVIKSIPSLCALFVGKIVLENHFSWFLFFLVFAIVGIINILSFERLFFWKIKDMKLNSLIDKIIERN